MSEKTHDGTAIRSPLRHLDVCKVGRKARTESRSRHNYLPPISVYRWWARRTEAVCGAVLDAVAQDRAGRMTVADPFAGGGVIALSAIIRGHQVYAQDINPYAAQSLATMLSLPPADQLQAAARMLQAACEPLLDKAYATQLGDGTPAQVAHTFRVATADCPSCSATLRLFPRALVSLHNRVDTLSADGTAVLACPAGHLIDGNVDEPTTCGTCNRDVDPKARYTTGRRASCHSCGWEGRLETLTAKQPFGWEVVLVERAGEGRRQIGRPTEAEIVQAASDTWDPSRPLDQIVPGEETRVLRRHGFTSWADCYPTRQRAVTEALLEACGPAAHGSQEVARALEAAVLGTIEMAGHSSRWDPRYLKAYEAVANHRFNLTTFASEPHVWGVPEGGRGTFLRRLELLAKASTWLEEQAGRPLQIQGPLAADQRRTRVGKDTDARVVAGSSQRLVAQRGSLDLVFTDPPYHDDVQYGELSQLFRSWAGLSTDPLENEAVVNSSRAEAATLEDYRRLLEEVFVEIRRALAADGHLILTYANRNPEAWVALFGALESAGFQTVGYEIVHSENETDHAKRGRKSCNLDILLDLVPIHVGTVEQHHPTGAIISDEEDFCRQIGQYALKIGSLKDGWQERLQDDLRKSAFLE